MTRMQLIANTPKMIDLPAHFFVGSIEYVTDDELVEDFFKTYNKLGFEQTRLITRDGNSLIVFYDDFSGWRVIITDIHVV